MQKNIFIVFFFNLMLISPVEVTLGLEDGIKQKKSVPFLGIIKFRETFFYEYLIFIRNGSDK